MKKKNATVGTWVQVKTDMNTFGYRGEYGKIEIAHSDQGVGVRFLDGGLTGFYFNELRLAK